MRHLLKCAACGSYTLKEKCDCGGSATTPKPAKFSPDDKYAKYRRSVKKEMYRKEGLL